MFCPVFATKGVLAYVVWLYPLVRIPTTDEVVDSDVALVIIKHLK